jgi:hypothetical protein
MLDKGPLGIGGGGGTTPLAVPAVKIIGSRTHTMKATQQNCSRKIFPTNLQEVEAQILQSVVRLRDLV